MITAAQASGNLFGNIQETTGLPINNLHTSCVDSEYTKQIKWKRLLEQAAICIFQRGHPNFYVFISYLFSQATFGRI
jgi:hypothetical protein